MKYYLCTLRQEGCSTYSYAWSLAVLFALILAGPPSYCLVKRSSQVATSVRAAEILLHCFLLQQCCLCWQGGAHTWLPETISASGITAQDWPATRGTGIYHMVSRAQSASLARTFLQI
jgi:hypothetical protein